MEGFSATQRTRIKALRAAVLTGAPSDEATIYTKLIPTFLASNEGRCRITPADTAQGANSFGVKFIDASRATDALGRLIFSRDSADRQGHRMPSGHGRLKFQFRFFS